MSMSDVGLKNYAVYPYQIDLKLSRLVCQGNELQRRRNMRALSLW